MARRFIALMIVLLLTLCNICISDSSEASSDGELLLDEGNGVTEWLTISSTGTISEAIISTLIANGHTVSISGSNMTVDGKTSTTIGSAGSGSLSISGTTGVMVTSTWHIYNWDGIEWKETTDISTQFTSSYLAVGFYPAGIVPVETPTYQSSWTMMGGDAESSYNQTADVSTGECSTIWSENPESTGESYGIYGAILYARGFAFVKYGHSAGLDETARIVCYNTSTGAKVWSMDIPLESEMSTSSMAIGGQYLYVQSASGALYAVDWRTGPESDYSNVYCINGSTYSSPTKIPQTTADITIGAYTNGPTSIIYDSGCVFIKSSNGMMYCFDETLNLVWSRQTDGPGYYLGCTVHGDYVAFGMYNGHLYILDKTNGSILVDQSVYQKKYSGNMIGCVNSPVFVEDNGHLYLFASFNDGRGMNVTTYGIVIYRFEGTSLTQVKMYLDDFKSVSNELTRAVDFKGVYFQSSDGTYILKTDGTYRLLSDFTANSNLSHAAPILLNNEYLYSTSYSSQKILVIDKDGRAIGTFSSPINEYCMISPTIVDGYIICGNDGGCYCLTGDPTPYVPANTSTPLWMTVLIIVAAAVTAIAVVWMVLRFALGWKKPFETLRKRINHYFYGDDVTHNRKGKRRLGTTLLFGILLTFIVGVVSICIGTGATLGPIDAISAAMSAIMKGGQDLSYEEMLIFNSRLPRTMAACAVGIGLSVAGAVYQAVIKNPLVEPYIMGVSSGAGTLAVAVIAYDFTFFNLVSSQSPYLTAIAAIIGGLLAFGLTMLMAIKTGGKSTNYVLSGIVVGLVFSAVQSLLMIMAGNNIASALSWLYGSFASITWEKVWLVLIPALTLSFIPLVWAKELNLILLGEDQARQMGLDAKRFESCMLIVASVLTAFCVAFCGIIGFVGLVIPHLSRMILGGDHRLMLPVSMAFGGFLLIASDLMARVLLTGYELPVGAITTCIGVPVFAYLLIKKGRNYDM